MLQIFVTEESGERYEITDLYWFEEQGFHSFNGDDLHGHRCKFEFYVNGVLIHTENCGKIPITT